MPSQSLIGNQYLLEVLADWFGGISTIGTIRTVWAIRNVVHTTFLMAQTVRMVPMVEIPPNQSASTSKRY
jgi:hypothetical protein